MGVVAEGLALAGRLALGGVFLVAATAKVRDRRRFAVVVRALVRRRGRVDGAVVAAVIGAELLVGGALVLGVFVRVAAGLGAALLLAFTVAVLGALARGVRTQCACFGRVHAGELGPELVVRNVVLAAAACTLAFLPDTLALVPGGGALGARALLSADLLLVVALVVAGLELRERHLPVPGRPGRPGIRWDPVAP